MPAEQRDRGVLVDIIARLDALNRIVQDMLMFARPRALRQEPVALAALLGDTVALIERDPTMSRVEIALSGAADISGDREMLQVVFQNLIGNMAFWDLMRDEQLGTTRRLAENALQAFPNPTPEQLASAAAATDPSLAFYAFRSGRFYRLGPWLSQRAFWDVAFRVCAVSVLLFLLDLLWIFAKGEPLILRWFGIAVVTRNGRRASRLRVLVRTALVGSGVLCIVFASSFLFSPPVWTDHSGIDVSEIAGFALACLTLVILALCVIRPSRSPQDYLTGTYLVLR
jgi:hypothetical protein